MQLLEALLQGAPQTQGNVPDTTGAGDSPFAALFAGLVAQTRQPGYQDGVSRIVPGAARGLIDAPVNAEPDLPSALPVGKAVSVAPSNPTTGAAQLAETPPQASTIGPATRSEPKATGVPKEVTPLTVAPLARGGVVGSTPAESFSQVSRPAPAQAKAAVASPSVEITANTRVTSTAASINMKKPAVNPLLAGDVEHTIIAPASARTPLGLAQTAAQAPRDAVSVTAATQTTRPVQTRSTPGNRHAPDRQNVAPTPSDRIVSQDQTPPRAVMFTPDANSFQKVTPEMAAPGAPPSAGAAGLSDGDLAQTPDTTLFRMDDDALSMRELSTTRTGPVSTDTRPTPARFNEAILAQVKSTEVTAERTRIELNPRGLGHIDIEISSDPASSTRILIRAENPHVLQALREERATLAVAIGISDDSQLQFDHRQRERSEQQLQPQRTSGPGETQQGEGAAATSERQSERHQVIDGVRLDIMT
ncbi:MAG: flagellar hook-length control protein FliK [Brevirhabdus sp.]